MNITAISPEVPVSTEHLKQTRAASDFEALLIGQMLKSMRNENSGWLGTGDDQSADAAFGLGEEELAKSLASHGGFGLARLIESGLRASAAEPANHADTAKR